METREFNYPFWIYPKQTSRSEKQYPNLTQEEVKKETEDCYDCMIRKRGLTRGAGWISYRHAWLCKANREKENVTS